MSKDLPKLTESQQNLIDDVKNNRDVSDILERPEISVNFYDEHKNTILHYAAENNNLETIRALLRRKDFQYISHRNDDGYTAMHLAAKNGHVLALNDMNITQANINSVDTEGNTPLCLAANNGHFETVKQLLILGAICYHPNADMDTPLHLATKNNHPQIVNLLCEADAHKYNINSKNNAGETPLNCAVKNNNPLSVQILCRFGADPRAQDMNMNTLLHLATKNNHPQIMNLLCEADIYGYSVNSKNNEGETPIHCAVKNDSPSAIKILCRFGADLEAEDNTGKTPLKIAAENNKFESFKMLVFVGSTINILTRSDDLSRARIFGELKKNKAKENEVEVLELLEKNEEWSDKDACLIPINHERVIKDALLKIERDPFAFSVEFENEILNRSKQMSQTTNASLAGATAKKAIQQNKSNNGCIIS